MCWNGHSGQKKVAEKDIEVYKIGRVRDPDFEEGPESNWNKALNSIINSVNKESNEDKD